MLTWEQWQVKAVSSLQASRILLENQKPIEAASRAYYAAYQMVTSILIRLRLSPSSEYGNWSHHETLEMYQTHICRKVDLGPREKAASKSHSNKLLHLLEIRYLADYGGTQRISLALAQSLCRDSGQLIKLLERLSERGLI